MGKILPLLLDSVEHETDIDLFLEQILRNIEIVFDDSYPITGSAFTNGSNSRT